MKRHFTIKPIKQALLAVPAAALMLGAAHAGTTVGLNFQQWYYNSGADPQTIGFNNGYSDYNTTGFPVTAKAFGVELANWSNTDPMGSQGNASPINQACTFGGTATTFAGGLSCNVNAPKGAHSSGSGELQSLNSSGTGYPITYAPGVWTPPGNDEVLWGNIMADDADPFSVSVTGLAAKFPNGYVIQTLAALGNTQPLLPRVDITDGTTTNTLSYHVWYIQNNPAAQWPSSTAGVSDPSGGFTADTIYINSRDDGTGVKSALAGFIITDKPVISQDPQGVTYPTGSTFTLSPLVAALPNSLAYQWRSNGVPVAGATAATYTIANATVADSASYDFIVTNLYGSATSAVAVVTVSVPANLTWDADAITTGAQDGPGTWDNGITADWWNGSSDVAFSSLAIATFGAGDTNAYSVNVTNNVTASRLAFNSGNYTIANANSATLTLGGVSPTITANANATLSVPLAGTAGLTKNGAGTLTLANNEIYSGGTVVNEGTVNLSVGGSSGTLQGALTVNSNATVVCTVNNALGYSGSDWVRTINLNFGTLTTSIANSDEGWGLIINMVGGTLGSTVANGRFAMGDSPVVNVTGTNVPSIISANLNVRDSAPGGIVFNVTRGTAAVDLDVTGPIVQQANGGITLNGGGIMQLSGVNTYIGDTIVSNGTLSVAGQLTGDGVVTLNDSTALNVTAGTLNAAINTTILTLGSSGTGADALGFADLNSTSLAPINAGSLTINNPVTVNITGTIPVAGQYPLIQYGGESGTGTFTLGTLPAGVSATLVDDHASSVYLNVTATPVQAETWTGTPNGTWDIDTTANWLIGSTPAKYEEANVVTFDDSASGTTAVTLNTNVHPSSVTFSNLVKNYSISGSGAIAGATSLTVSGTGMVTLNNTNTYAGGTILNAGTLAVAADASLGTGPLTFDGGALDIAGATAFASGKSVTLNGNGGTIQVDNPAGASFAPMTGSGALTKNGDGTLTFGAQQTYSGGTTINGGVLDLTGGGGSSGVIRGMATINTGATLRLSTGDAIGYSQPNNLGSIYITGGTLVVNTTANQTLGGATITMTGGAITGLTGGNLDFFGGSSALNTYSSPTTATISGVPLSPLRQGSTTFDVQAGTTPSGIDLDISSVLRVSPSGDAVGATLYKADTGTMRLSAVNTYQGATEVIQGTLILTGRLIGGGAVTVDDGATLIVSSGVKSAIVTSNDLTLGSGSLSLTLGFDNVNSTNVPLASVGNVTVNDAVTVNIGGKVAVGQCPLIKYGGTETGAGSFTLGTLPAGVSASLVNNTANQSLDLLVTSAPLSIITDISSGTNYAYAGANYALVVAAGGNPTLGYQWYQNDAPIQGATSSTLALTRLTSANIGSYYVVVTNASGSISSSTNHLVVVPVSGYAAMAIATTPVAYWPLNEPAGPTAIDYMGGHNANYSSSGVTYGVTGPVGTNAIAVDGSSGQVAAPYSPDLNPAGPFTAEAWLKPASVTSSLMCALSSSHAASPRAGWLIYGSTAGWDFRTYNQNGLNTAVDITGGTPTAGTWDHVAVVWDGSKGYLYVNGVLKNTSVATNFVANADGSFTVGSRSDSAFYWGGSAADVAFYNRVLTPQEIQTHAQNRPSLAITPAAGKVVLSWVPSGGGTLLASPTVNGPYTNVPAATSPWTNSPAGNQFYRVGF